MKAAAFELVWPTTLSEATNLTGRIIAGGQSLGPMLNLRVVRPGKLIAISKLKELKGVADGAEEITIGACVTHAKIADGLLPALGPDPHAASILPSIAEGIAYRAVRNRGTIGGSLCHADPAADWVCTLSALGAFVLIAPSNRLIPVQNFITGAFRNTLAPREIVQAVRIPKISASARWGYVKFCRKPGDFAHAMAAVLIDGVTRRAAIGALGGPPLILKDDDFDNAESILKKANTGLDDIALNLQLVAFSRAFAQARSGEK